MTEIDLMRLYPRSKRSIEDRGSSITGLDREISRRFDKDYFDGDRRHGYGGYSYHPRFWQKTVGLFRDHYALADEGSVLDVGCGKGFMLHDFKELMPKLEIAGLDVSQYAIEHAIETVKPMLRIGDARELPYKDNSFDLVIAINTVHNLPPGECEQALREIQRVSRTHAFITVDAWRTQDERQRLENWILTAKTYMHVDDWKQIFHEVGYTGDYYWFFP